MGLPREFGEIRRFTDKTEREIIRKLAVDFSPFHGNKFPSRRKTAVFRPPRHGPPAANTQSESERIMVKIRMRREGTKDRPYYRIVVADQRARREGAFIEQIGTYDPLAAQGGFKIDLAKADEWIGKGAQPSDTVRSLMKKARQASA
jgi:small subunit ribosomal protein S16